MCCKYFKYVKTGNRLIGFDDEYGELKKIYLTGLIGRNYRK